MELEENNDRTLRNELRLGNILDRQKHYQLAKKMVCGEKYFPTDETDFSWDRYISPPTEIFLNRQKKKTLDHFCSVHDQIERQVPPGNLEILGTFCSTWDFKLGAILAVIGVIYKCSVSLTSAKMI